jgi:hypothetical protein
MGAEQLEPPTLTADDATGAWLMNFLGSSVLAKSG